MTMRTGLGIDELLRAAPRLTQIAGGLARHGFLSALRGERHWPPPEEAREAFEELGVVFLKFGQVLALRRDLLPDAYVEQLERLHDRLPAMNFDDVLTTIETELGAPIEDLFASFVREPLAAATIAQVHEATLRDGRHVVVKTRRPNIKAVIAEDIAALGYTAALAENLSPQLRALDLVGMVRQLNESLRRETDFRIEARNIKRFREALALRSIFESGLFHADSHPGNVFVLPDGRICLHDFGMTGELDEQMRESLMRLLEATINDDARAATEAYLELGTATEEINRVELEADIGALLREVRGRPLAEISVGDTFRLLLRTGGRHGALGRGEFLLLARAFLITEALMRQMDPQMNVIELYEGELARITAQRYSPARILDQSRKLAGEFERLARETPADARRALRRIAEGNLGRVYAPTLESLGRRLSRDIERLTGAIASAALVIAGSMLVGLGGWRGLLGQPEDEAGAGRLHGYRRILSDNRTPGAPVRRPALPPDFVVSTAALFHARWARRAWRAPRRPQRRNGENRKPRTLILRRKICKALPLTDYGCW